MEYDVNYLQTLRPVTSILKFATFADLLVGTPTLILLSNPAQWQAAL